MNRHKVFVSYHHANDQFYREQFENLFFNTYNVIVSKSVRIGDIDPLLPVDRIRQIIRENYLRDSTVTVVLIGIDTWRRKHVDWEIGASIRATKYSSRSGLLGIYLPTHPDFGKDKYYKSLLPPRLSENVECKFATLHDWSTNPNLVVDWIHQAFLRRNSINPNNSYPNFNNNRKGNGWS